jgi:chitinase domain-containing protein 1
MTYDFSTHNSMIGPNAPLDWVEKNVVYYTDDPKYRAKILMGLNFYGYYYIMDLKGKLQKQPEPIVGSQLIEMLKNPQYNAQIKFDEKSVEHMVLLRDTNTQTIVFFPTLYSIQQRISINLT